MKYEVGQVLFFDYSGNILNLKNVFHNAINLYNLLEFGQSDTTHTAHVVGVEDDQVLVCEAVGELIVTAYPAWWLDCRIEEDVLSVYTPENADEALVADYLAEYKGTPYDWRAIAGIGLELVGIHLEVLGSERLFCSEATVEFLRIVCGIDVAKALGKKAGRITPQELYMYLFNIKQEKSLILAHTSCSTPSFLASFLG